MADKRFEYEISANVEQFKRSMEAVARESRESARAVQTSFGNVERSLGSLTSLAGGLKGVLAGALSIGTVVQFGRAIMDSTLEAERSTALLNATLRSTGYAAGLTARDVEGLVAELSKVSGFDDDPIREGTTALLRFRDVSGETFKEASRLAVDLAVATGRDLPSSFVAVGKALQNPITGMKGLRDAGVQLSEGQAELAQKLMDTGRTAEAQKLVLDQLAASVGGSGATAGGGLTGATRSLANAWDDLLKNLGRTAIVSQTTRGALDSLAGGLNFANRLLAEQDSGLAGTINVPGQTARPKIGTLSEAESLSLRGVGPQVRIAEPRKTDTSAAKKAASDAQARYEAEYQAALAAGKAFSDEEIRQLERAADEKIRIEQDVQAERIKLLQEGPDIAERQQREQTQRLNALLGQTKSGQEQAVIKDLDLLNEALIRGTISAEQYEEAYGNIQERFDEIRDVGKDSFKDLSDSGARAMRDLQMAVEGWGNATADTIVQMVKTGKFEFSRLVDVILTDLARLAVQQTTTRPIFGAIANALGGLNLFGSGSAPSSSGTPFGYSYGGGRASGGAVSGGQWYTVGENGPERLYVPPGGNGTIVPNGGGGGINYRQTVVINAPTDGAVIRAAVMQGAAMARSDIARLGRVGAMS